MRQFKGITKFANMLLLKLFSLFCENIIKDFYDFLRAPLSSKLLDLYPAVFITTGKISAESVINPT